MHQLVCGATSIQGKQVVASTTHCCNSGFAEIKVRKMILKKLMIYGFVYFITPSIYRPLTQL